MDILKTIRLRQTPQAPAATPGQVRNAAGGYTFPVDDWARVHRFLTLGTDGGTYYTADRELTRDNAEVVLRVAATDPVGLVNRIVEVSEAGRAPKANPALFALAIAASSEDVDGRRAALAALPGSPARQLTCSCSPVTSSSSAGGGRRCVAPYPVGTPSVPSMRWPTSW